MGQPRRPHVLADVVRHHALVTDDERRYQPARILREPRDRLAQSSSQWLGEAAGPPRPVDRLGRVVHPQDSCDVAATVVRGPADRAWTPPGPAAAPPIRCRSPATAPGCAPERRHPGRSPSRSAAARSHTRTRRRRLPSVRNCGSVTRTPSTCTAAPPAARSSTGPARTPAARAAPSERAADETGQGRECRES